MDKTVFDYYVRKIRRLLDRAETANPPQDKLALLSAARQTVKALKAAYNENPRIVTDGGPGSGNFGHEGRPGEKGGSMPNASSINDSIKEASKKGYLEFDRAVRKALSDAPVGQKIKTEHFTFKKLGDDKYECDYNGRKTIENTNYVANTSVDYDVLPVFEDISSEEVAQAKIESGELKPSETSVKTPEMTIEQKELQSYEGFAAKAHDKLKSTKKAYDKSAKNGLPSHDAAENYAYAQNEDFEMRCKVLRYKRKNDPEGYKKEMKKLLGELPIGARFEQSYSNSGGPVFEKVGKNKYIMHGTGKTISESEMLKRSESSYELKDFSVPKGKNELSDYFQKELKKGNTNIFTDVYYDFYPERRLAQGYTTDKKRDFMYDVVTFEEDRNEYAVDYDKVIEFYDTSGNYTGFYMRDRDPEMS